MKKTINHLDSILEQLHDIKDYELTDKLWKGHEETASIIYSIIDEFIDNLEEQLDKAEHE